MPSDRRIVVLVFLSIATFANCLYSYREYAQIKQTNVFVDSVIRGTNTVSYSAAGWPWVFYQQFDCQGSSSWIVWDSIRLVGDFLFWIVVFAFCWWYSGTRRGQSNDSKTKIRWRWSLIDLLVVMLLIASGLGYFARMQAGYAESQRLIKVIRSQGGVASEGHYLPAWFPADPLLSTILPRNRILMASLENPPSSLVKEVVALPHLQSLRLSGSSYPLSDLQPLAGNPNLTDLRISGREIDAPTIELISRIKSLQALNLMQTNITAADVSDLGEMPRLRYLYLLQTDVELQDSKLEPWMRSVRYLRLPRPKSLDLHLDGWPELEDFQCMEVDDPVDINPVTLSISNAPKLQTLSIIQAQLFNLSLCDLPSFEAIHYSLGVGVRESKPRVWIQSAELKNLPTITNVRIKLSDLKSVRVENCPQLECDASWTADYVKRFSFSDAQQSIAGVGNSIGITSLNLKELPIDKLDLSPIAACQTIKRLDLPIASISSAQLQSLSPLNAIEELKLTWTNVPPAESLVAEYLRVWPTLKRILGNDQRMGMFVPDRERATVVHHNAIRLESADNLESFMKGDWRESPAVRLIDLPRFKDSVQVSRNLQSIHIHGSPNLRSLLTHAPWPQDASIEGLKELTTFSAGGARFQDNEFSGIEASTELKSLTLGYCGVTPAKLSAVGKFTKLSSLGLTGSAVTDETVRGWTKLRSLRHLMLDRTQVTAASVPWICTLRSLEHLSINSACFAPVTPEQLNALNSLQSLSLYGDGIKLERLTTIAKWENISMLRIENAMLTGGMLMQLLDCLPKSLSVLDLCNCKTDPNELAEFIPALPRKIRLGVLGLDVPVDLQSELLVGFRAVVENPGDYFAGGVNGFSTLSSQWPTRSQSDSNSTYMTDGGSIPSTSSANGQIPTVFVRPSVFAPNSPSVALPTKK